MSGYIPGLMWALAYMVVAYVIAQKNHYPTAGKAVSYTHLKYCSVLSNTYGIEKMAYALLNCSMLEAETFAIRCV